MKHFLLLIALCSNLTTFAQESMTPNLHGILRGNDADELETPKSFSSFIDDDDDDDWDDDEDDDD